MTYNEKIDVIAQCIWQAESMRASGKYRNIDWSDVNITTLSNYSFIAEAVYILVKKYQL